MAPARGGDRTDRGRRRRVPAGRILCALAGTVLMVGALGCAPPASAAGSGRSGPTLTLLAPPTIAGPDSPFAVRLAVSSHVARSELTLAVTVYGAVTTPTEFDETLDGSPVGTAVSSSADPIAVSSLPSDPAGGVDLTVPVTAGGVTGPGTGPFIADLPCSQGSCGGVYPVQLVLTDTASGAVTSRLLTYLAYTYPPVSEPLRFALVVPLTLSSSSTGPAPSVAAVTPASLATLTSVMGAISGSAATVPLTIAPDPATVSALTADTRVRSKAALSALVSLTAGTDRQTLCGPFVSVDASALVNPALGGATELADQVRRGVQVLDAVPGLRTTDCASGNTWVADDTLDNAALAALGALGDRAVVVPPSAVSGPNPPTTPTRLFTWAGAPQSGTAILSDPGLSARLQSTARTDPALAADQLLAELEFDFSEAPNTSKPRGVVVAPPASWHANPTILADVLAGLQHNPMVEPVTLATLFSEVPVGGTVGNFTQPSSRRPAPYDTSTGLPTAAIAAARAQWTGFSDAVSGSGAGTAVAAGLDDLLLGAEAQRLRPSQQRAAVGGFENAVRRQLALLSIASREVRLTASTGSVPITVIKTAPYPVEAVLTLTSDKIAFSAYGAQAPNSECKAPVITSAASRSSVSTLCTFVHGTNAVYIEMRSRVSGDFQMSVSLNSPQAGLPLASGQLTVRSMSTSAVAIALTVAAGAVLLGWWGRTLWRTRRTRRTRRGVHRQRDGPAS